MNPNEELNGLGYVSSATDFITVDDVKPQDEADISTLDGIFKLIHNRKAYFSSIDSLAIGGELSVQEQVAVNKKVLFHIQELEGMISGVINKIKEKQNGR